MNASHSTLPVAVVGAGPVGMAAAAHLLERGFTPLVFEAAAGPGGNLESVRHVRLFSPWRYNVDHAARRLLEAHGWHMPDQEALPTAGALIDDYLRPLADLPVMRTHLRFGQRVLRISRDGLDKVKTAGRASLPFLVRTERDEYRVQAVIDASGTWSQPNPIGAAGIPAVGEEALSGRIAYGMPDIEGVQRPRYAGKRVLVIGTGHSAAGNLLALARVADEAPGTSIVWAVRGADVAKAFGGGEADGLPARGQLGSALRRLQEQGRLEMHTGFRTRALHWQADGTIVVESAGQSITGVAEIIAATGARPDLSLARELRVALDPWLESTPALAPLIDPNLHSCGTVRPHGHRALAHPEPGYYAVGAKSYGRAPNFLMATGYEQVRSIAAALAGDIAGADRVQLELPETGVCMIDAPQEGLVSTCCDSKPASTPFCATSSCATSGSAGAACSAPACA